MDDPKVVFLIYSNGSLVCLGAKSEKDVSRAVDKLKRRLEELDVMYGKSKTTGR
jgi:transcription initiation factor TFIID TATA-box-binding protein